MDYAGNVARFSEAFYKCCNVESEGNDQWRPTFVNWRAIFLPRRRAETFYKDSSFDISSIGFENLVPPGLASHSVTSR